MKNLIVWIWNIIMAAIFTWAWKHFGTGNGETIGFGLLFIAGLIFRFYQLIKSGEIESYWPEIIMAISSFALAIVGSEIWHG